ncbi:phage head protein [Escherichia coli]|nr:phage head protein [Escherichia coli]
MDGTVWRLLNRFMLFCEKLDTRRGPTSPPANAVKSLGGGRSFEGYYGMVASVVGVQD